MMDIAATLFKKKLNVMVSNKFKRCKIQQKGIRTFIKFFNEKQPYLKKNLSADIIFALNVVGHVPDLLSFIKG